MSISQFFQLFILALPIVLVIDLVWIGIFAKNFYKKHLKEIARMEGDTMKPNWAASVLVYLVMISAFILFVLPKIPTDGNFLQAIFWGSVFGLSFSGVYNLTNYALFAKYPLKVVVVDMTWAFFFSGAIGLIIWNLNNFLS
ncbi:MAG: DUF2177 family protein [Candidatus Woykebacteria bacterium]